MSYFLRGDGILKAIHTGHLLNENSPSYGELASAKKVDVEPKAYCTSRKCCEYEIVVPREVVRVWDKKHKIYKHKEYLNRSKRLLKPRVPKKTKTTKCPDCGHAVTFLY